MQNYVVWDWFSHRVLEGEPKIHIHLLTTGSIPTEDHREDYHGRTKFQAEKRRTNKEEDQRQVMTKD